MISGRISASSQASSALSTASFTQVRSAFRGLSKPRRWRFFEKNSETEISLCFAPISTAVTAFSFFPIIEILYGGSNQPHSSFNMISLREHVKRLDLFYFVSSYRKYF